MSTSAFKYPIFTTNLPTQYDVYPFIDTDKFLGKLEGKVALCTGASSGIGRATALAFAAAGASIAIVARRKANLDELAAEIKSKHRVPVAVISADLTDPAAPSHILQAVQVTLGPVDILINNAGAVRVGKLADEPSFETWSRVLRLNLEAPAALIHAILPSMLARRTGTIICVASQAGAHDMEFVTAYSTSKAGLIKLHQALSLEHQDDGVAFFSLSPGTIKSDITKSPDVNMESFMKHKMLQVYTQEFAKLDRWQTSELAANTMVALCAEDRCKVLNGRYVDAEQDLEEVLKIAESGRMQKERLYWLKVDEV